MGRGSRQWVICSGEWHALSTEPKPQKSSHPAFDVEAVSSDEETLVVTKKFGGAPPPARDSRDSIGQLRREKEAGGPNDR